MTHFSEPGQGTSEEHKSKDYRRELEERERQSRREKDKVTSNCTQCLVKCWLLLVGWTDGDCAR